MNIILTLAAISVGLLIIFSVLKTGKNRLINEVNALVWLMGGAGIIFLGIFPDIITSSARLLEIYWPPAVLIFFLLVLIFLILFSHTKSVSVLTNQVTELTTHVSLLKHENKKLEALIAENNKVEVE